ncbi:MAG TPA: translocation/assembly module TamB domain-containing protein, partial [Burkholderiaceae bacterium]|nr:translocation/assembly module TamB domain-containing protein [Burkholderiaceae bacterium]
RLDVQASLYRASGDLSLVTDPKSGGARATLAAGVRQARLSASSNGNELNLELHWQTERAGTVNAAMSTRLSRAEPGGGWTIADDAPLNGTLQAQLPKIGVWSQLAPPGWRLEGAIDADLRVAGTLTDPRMTGSIEADDLALRSIVDGFEFGDGRLRARVDGQKLTIDEFTLYGAGGKAHGGSILVTGSAELADGKPLVKMDVKLDHLQPSIRTDAEIAVSGAVRARLEDRLATVTGALHVDRARIELPENSAPALGEDVVVRHGDAADAKAASATRAPGDAAPLAVKLDVAIALGDDFQVSGFGLNTRLEGRLAVVGESLSDPRVTGEIRTVDGKFRAYGQRLDVAHGLIRFTGKPTNPSLDILALRACERCEVKAGVEVTGTALLPRVRLYSDPNVPDSDKLSWLVLGRAVPADGAEAALLQAAALAFVSGKNSGGGFAEKLGLDELSLGEAKGGDSAGTTAVTIGKRFSKNFYAAYERSLSGAVGTLFLFYDLTERLTLRGETGERSALDLIYTLKYD